MGVLALVECGSHGQPGWPVVTVAEASGQQGCTPGRLDLTLAHVGRVNLAPKTVRFHCRGLRPPMRPRGPPIPLLGKHLGSWARGCQIVRRTWEPPVTLDTQRWRELAAVLLSLKIRNLNDVEEVLDQNISEGLLTRSDEGDSGTHPRDVHAATLSPGVWGGRGKGRPSQGG